MTIIAHIDMDAFFASIEERDNPRLAGRPIVVGSDPQGGRGRGVVSTANYAARAYGIRSALPISRAWRFSEEARQRGLPPAVFMEVNMKKYGEVSRAIMTSVADILARESGRPAVIAQASVDEAYADISFAGSYEEAARVARAIQEGIFEVARLTASVGVGPNKLIAKIASDYEKPNGFTVVREGDAESFIAPMSIRVIPGVGPKTQDRLTAIGVRTVADARRFSLDELREMMGRWGEDLYEKIRAHGDATIVQDHELKSVSEQTTFAHDVPVAGKNATRDRKLLTAALAALADNVAARLEEEGGDGTDLDGFTTFRAVGITVRFADFTTKTRVVTLPKPVTVAGPVAGETIRFQTLRLFMPFLDRRENPDHKAIRLLGVRAERLG